MAAEGGHAGDAQPALQLAMQQRQIGLRFFSSQHRAHAQIALAGFGQRHGARGARDQARAQFALQPGDVLAGCGGRNAQLARAEAMEPPSRALTKVSMARRFGTKTYG
jgi:hypothetical protein